MLGLLTLSALLCAVAGQAQESGDTMLHDMYLNKCNKAFPKSKTMEVYYYNWEMSCAYYCAGTRKDGTYIFQGFPKEDDTKCSLNYLDREASRCLNGTCILNTDIEHCEDKLDGKVLKAVENYYCYLMCYGTDSSYPDVVKKEKGADCVIAGYSLRKAKCDSNAYCASVKNFVDEPQGGEKDNDKAADLVCKSRHDTPIAAAKFTGGGCEYACIYNETDVTKFEWMDFQNGRSCGDGFNCLGGECIDPADVQACKNVLKDDPLNEIIYIECTMGCMGENTVQGISMAANRKCTKKVNEWSTRSGHCNKDNECILD